MFVLAKKCSFFIWPLWKVLMLRVCSIFVWIMIDIQWLSLERKEHRQSLSLFIWRDLFDLVLVLKFQFSYFFCIFQLNKCAEFCLRNDKKKRFHNLFWISFCKKKIIISWIVSYCELSDHYITSFFKFSLQNKLFTPVSLFGSLCLCYVLSAVLLLHLTLCTPP